MIRAPLSGSRGVREDVGRCLLPVAVSRALTDTSFGMLSEYVLVLRPARSHQDPKNRCAGTRHQTNPRSSGRRS
jgi:hypothetical protein